MKRFFQCAAAAALLVLLGACSMFEADKTAAVKIDAIEVNDREAAISEGHNIGKTLMEAVKNNDFAAVETLPIGDGKVKYPKEKFDNLVKLVQARGGIASYSYLGEMNMKHYIRLFWKVTFAGTADKKGSDIDMFFELNIVKLDGVNRVSAFGFHL